MDILGRNIFSIQVQITQVKKNTNNNVASCKFMQSKFAVAKENLKKNEGGNFTKSNFHEVVELEISNAGRIFSKWRLFLSGYFTRRRGQSPLCLTSSRVYKPLDKTGSAMNFVVAKENLKKKEGGNFAKK